VIDVHLKGHYCCTRPLVRYINAWLASDAAKDVTAQIFHVARGTVAIMQQPALIRSFKNDTLWSLEQLDQIMPKLVEAKGENDARARETSAPEAMSGPASKL
jgi:hypothetical protein